MSRVQTREMNLYLRGFSYRHHFWLIDGFAVVHMEYMLLLRLTSSNHWCIDITSNANTVNGLPRSTIGSWLPCLLLALEFSGKLLIVFIVGQYAVALATRWRLYWGHSSTVWILRRLPTGIIEERTADVVLNYQVVMVVKGVGSQIVRRGLLA